MELANGNERRSSIVLGMRRKIPAGPRRIMAFIKKGNVEAKDIVIAQPRKNAISEEPHDAEPVQDSEDDAMASRSCIAKSPASWCMPFGLIE